MESNYDKAYEANKEKDYINMIKYYRNAIAEDQCYDSMTELACYADKDDNIELTVKAYLIAMDKNINVASYLASYYIKCQDPENAIKYINKINNSDDLYVLHEMYCYYEDLNDIEHVIKYGKILVDNFNQEKYNNNCFFSIFYEKDDFFKIFNTAITYYLTNNDILNVEKWFMLMLNQDIEYKNHKAEDLIYNVITFYKNKDISTFSKCYRAICDIGISFSKNESPKYYYKFFDEDNCWCSSDILSGNLILDRAMDDSWSKLQIIKFYYNCEDFDKFEYHINKFMNSKYEINNDDSLKEIYKIIENIDDSKIKTIGVKMIKQLLQKQLNLLDLHIKYAPEGTGYEEAKQHFYQQLI